MPLGKALELPILTGVCLPETTSLKLLVRARNCVVWNRSSHDGNDMVTSAKVKKEMLFGCVYKAQKMRWCYWTGMVKVALLQVTCKGVNRMQIRYAFDVLWLTLHS